MLSPSILVPSLNYEGIKVWDTLAIAKFLHEIRPKSSLLPGDLAARAHCRAIYGEMHSGFSSLRPTLPMNLKAHFRGHKIWARAVGNIERITTIWRKCLTFTDPGWTEVGVKMSKSGCVLATTGISSSKNCVRTARRTASHASANSDG